MKKNILIILLFASCYCSAQHIEYVYDAVGNRLSSTYYSTGDRAANPSPPKDSTISSKYGISVYPNPTSDNINVIIAKLENGQSADVYLYNEQGKTLLSKKQATAQDNVEMSGLSSGIYQLRVVVNGEIANYRIVKM